MRLIAQLPFIIAISFLAALFYWSFYTPKELTFSDGAHYAVIARQFYQTNTWTDRFSFFGPSVFHKLGSGNVFPTSILPLTPLSIWASFKIFGVSDFSAVIPSVVFFALISTIIFILLQRRHGELMAWLGFFTFITFTPFLDYATSAATEPLFTLLLLVAFVFLTSSKKILKLLSIPFILLTFISRPHAPFYLPAFIALFLYNLNPLQRKKFFLISIALIIASIPFWHEISQRVPYLNALGQSQIFFAGSTLMPANTALRAGTQAFAFSIVDNIKVLLVKIFYNSYNLLKLLPKIFPPYLIPFITIAIFIKKTPKSLLIFFVVSGLVNLLAIAASVPSFRYLHPLLPFAIILGFSAFSKIIEKLNLTTLKASTLGLFLFVLVPLSGLILDARFVQATHHVGKPSAIKVLGQPLSELTPEDSIVITNLDVWGTWYGNRTTIWFPLVPNQIDDIAKVFGNNPVDYIYITSYRAQDENLFVGEQWQSLLQDTPTITNDFLRENYTIIKIIDITPEDNYDNIPLKAVLLKRI